MQWVRNAKGPDENANDQDPVMVELSTVGPESNPHLVRQRSNTQVGADPLFGIPRMATSRLRRNGFSVVHDGHSPRNSPQIDKVIQHLVLPTVILVGLATIFDRVNYNDVDIFLGWLIVYGVLTLGLGVARSPAAGPMTVIFGLLIGIRERLVAIPRQDSDVLLATREAIDVMLSGGNPYSHYYQDTIPPGSPFTYPIGEPFFYWIHQTLFGRIDYADLWSGIFILILFAALSPVIGWVRSAVAIMAYSVSSEVVLNAAGGSNDTSLALLLILSLSLLIYGTSARTPRRWRLLLLIVSAVFFGWALLFKQFALIIFPFIVLALRQRGERWVLFSVISISLAMIAMAPYVLDDPAGVYHYLSRGGAHNFIWGLNLWTLLGLNAPNVVSTLYPYISLIQLLLSGAIGLALLMRRRTDLGCALLAGMATCVTLSFLANWTSSAYYIGFWPIIVFAVASIGSPALALSPRALSLAPTSVIPLPDWLNGRQVALDTPDRRKPGSGLRNIHIRRQTLDVLGRGSIAFRIARHQAASRITSSNGVPLAPTGLRLKSGVPQRAAEDQLTLLGLRWVHLRPLFDRTAIWLGKLHRSIVAIGVRSLIHPVTIVGYAILIGTLLRAFQIDSNPPGLNQDEAVGGYDAYSLWKTLRDHHGNTLPIVGFLSFGDWVSPFLTFFLVPIVGIFGLDTATIRAGTILLGIAGVVFTYLLTVELTGRRYTGAAAASFLSISPWAVHLSRLAIPPATVLCLFPLALWLVLRAIRVQSRSSVILAAVALSLVMLGYPTMKLYVPLVGALVAIVYLRDWIRIPIRTLFWGVVTLACLSGPNFLFTLRSQDASNRQRFISIFNRDDVSLSLLVQQYGSYINPHYLFINRNENDAADAASRFTTELSWTIPFLIIGVLAMIFRLINPETPMRFRRPAFMLTGLILLAPVPGMFTTIQNGSRETQLIVLMAIVSGIGLVTMGDFLYRALRRLATSPLRPAAVLTILLLLLLPLGVEARDRYHGYYHDYPRDGWVQLYFHTGLAGAVKYAYGVQDDYDTIWLVDTNQGYTILLLVNRVDPNLVQDDLEVEGEDFGSYVVNGLGKFRVTDVYQGLPEDVVLLNQRVVFESFPYTTGRGYIVRAGESPDGRRLLVISTEVRS